MNKTPTNKFSPEMRERAVRLVQEHRGEYPSLWAAVESIAPKIGCMATTLLSWVKRHEVDSGQRDGVTSSERERIKALERENRGGSTHIGNIKVASWLALVDAAFRPTLQAIIRGRADINSVIHTDGWRGYDGLVDIGFDKHFRVNHWHENRYLELLNPLPNYSMRHQ